MGILSRCEARDGVPCLTSREPQAASSLFGTWTAAGLAVNCREEVAAISLMKTQPRGDMSDILAPAWTLMSSQ